MKISIVIGALNEEKYIGKTLETAKAQKTKHKFEIIVGDGCSEDKTAEIARKAGAKVVLEKRRSAAFERNAGARLAKGEVIAFTDADVNIPENWVETIADDFEKDKSLAMLYGPVYFSDMGKLTSFLSKFFMSLYLCITSLLGLHNPIGSNLAVRRKFFEEVGGFNTERITAEDLDLAKRISAKGKVKYSGKMLMDASSRRLKKWGLLKYLTFHLSNGLRFWLTGKSKKEYEEIR